MKITLSEINFTEEEIDSCLQSNGYRIEEQKTPGYCIGGLDPIDTPKKYAIPNGEEFDKKKHQRVDKAFEELIQYGIKKFLLNLV